jgi:RNA polymerase sigma-70 factor (ECF subfamily)
VADADASEAGAESDALLLASAAPEDAGAAFTTLVERHSAALHAYFARRVPAAADDLLGEAWLQAYAARRGYDARRGTARAWLFGVARNILAAHLRRTATTRHGGEAAAGAAVDPWQAVDRRLDAAALAPALRTALAALPAEEREVLLLVAWEELTPTEAAAVVGVPAGTARSRLHRARGRLRARLPAADPDAPDPRASTEPRTTGTDHHLERTR